MNAAKTYSPQMTEHMIKHLKQEMLKAKAKIKLHKASVCAEHILAQLHQMYGTVVLQHINIK